MKKSIYIPHLNYTVKVRQIKSVPDELPNALAYVKATSSNGCELYIDFKRKLIAGDVAHELIHVLQFICHARNINFTLEQEHMGYLMQWLMGEVMGYSWK